MSDMSSDKLTVLGRITAVYGIKGWVKVFSHTQPMENILDYSPWLLNLDGRWTEVKLAEGKRHGKGIIVRLAGVDDRDQARKYCNLDIAVEQSRLPELEEGDYYWSQLEKLSVYTLSGELLGKVHHLIETGSNDVLVVRKCAGSIDKRERLIPYLPDQVIKEIDLEAGTLRVDWDPEF
ncbi:ribosome maturation factor RimM [Marinobacterium arenosum]|uniref:ribosome maturation factor RimM n=1 Tax=Marinobacterium arenosum TaxID=2862496 RepID=UPI001C981A4B|nr:ribosome maturation factor RimM [Marinobacterium arenosum]MBY4676146.1 ribosome maturation factor RimM [Marinobacterium arenosum]